MTRTDLGLGRARATRCPYCGTSHGQAVPIGDAGALLNEPEDGDISLCVRCGRWVIFDSTASGGMREPTPEEHRTITRDVHARRLRSAYAEGVARKRKRQALE
jgi:hypothetical protein